MLNNKTDSSPRILHGTSEIGLVRWHELTQSSPVVSFFQSPDAHNFFASCGGMRSEVYGVEEAGRLTGVVVVTLYREEGFLRRRVTSRAIVNGGPLLAGDIGHDALRLLLTTVVANLRHRCIYLETRNFNDYTRWKTVFEETGFSYKPHYNFHIVTDGFLERLTKTRRYEVRRAIREGATVDTDPTPEDMNSLYDILLHLYRTRVKLPLFRREFFEKLYRQPFSHFIVVKHEGHVIGGTICVGLPGQTLYEWFACGQDADGKHLFPSTVATFGAIDYASTHGHPLFDMMGAGSPGDGGYGVRDFKAQFGGTLVEHGRYLYVCNHAIYALGKLYIRLKSKR